MPPLRTGRGARLVSVNPSASTSAGDRSLTIVVPLCNEAAGVEALAAALARVRDSADRPVDWVLVDDGSTDATWQRLTACFPELAAERLLRHPARRGLTEALATGGRAATGAYVAWLDADLTYDPAVLLPLAAALDAGADVACASCYHPDGRVVGVPAWRLWLSGLASRIYRRVTGAGIHTFTCMVRVYRREVLASCWPRRGGFVGVTEILLRALARGHRVAEVPATLHRRRAGQSKMRVLRVGLAHLGLMISTARRRVRTGRYGV